MNELCYLCGQPIEGSGCYNSGMGVHYHLTCSMTVPPRPLHWRTEPPDRPGWWLSFNSNPNVYPSMHVGFYTMGVLNCTIFDCPETVWFGPIEKPEVKE